LSLFYYYCVLRGNTPATLTQAKNFSIFYYFYRVLINPYYLLPPKEVQIFYPLNNKKKNDLCRKTVIIQCKSNQYCTTFNGARADGTFDLLHYSAIFTQTVTAVTLILLLNRPILHFTCIQSILAARKFYAYGIVPECKTTPQRQNF
jgi:hypothetical protein